MMILLDFLGIYSSLLKIYHKFLISIMNSNLANELCFATIIYKIMYYFLSLVMSDSDLSGSSIGDEQPIYYF